ncbi:MAG: 16S rRNA (adenine(1518)-N(6)/adenine(1519)-N(6))-dimethyltransferase RsmA [Chitinophagales bacterium]|nr:16S rRNA (adenine(1518)-N(6)/adenine(1519)-N(6))-dimethyltransferase RsmA [Chitinophagales bacterium]MDW8394483.1 16S rRNA (adenine(1518)-N(6)/adenine(1519)-N(6))-dimethyltransferase RsmA [Chitinophagales bacterium]
MRVPRARKAWGQHFLADGNIAGKMVAALMDKRPSGPVLEIGPGTGVLTGRLLKAGADLWAIEVDGRMIELLQRQFPQLKQRLIHGDFLQYNFSDLKEAQLSIVGNFPYNISSQILIRVYEWRGQIPLLVGMFQKEMARRIASAPGNKDFGILSVLIQAAYRVDYLFEVSPNCFVPPPQVDSAVLRLERIHPQPSYPDDVLRRLLRAGFGQRRKQLRNSLRHLLPSAFPLTDSRLQLRPEQLTVNDWLLLSRDVRNCSGNQP